MHRCKFGCHQCQQSHHDRYLALHTCLQAPAPTHLNSGLPTVEIGALGLFWLGRQLRVSRRNYKVVVLRLAVDAVQKKGLFLCRAMSAQEISLQKVSFQRFPKVSKGFCVEISLCFGFQVAYRLESRSKSFQVPNVWFRPDLLTTWPTSAWIFMDIHGYSWIFMDIHGYSWIFMDIHGSRNQVEMIAALHAGSVEWFQATTSRLLSGCCTS